MFANNRLATEILTTYLKEACAQLPFSHGAVRGYRGGYLPKERRDIERRLATGEIRARRRHQRARTRNRYRLARCRGTGRIPRHDRFYLAACRPRRAPPDSSVAVLVASSAPLDQYIVEHPDYFFGQSPEQAHINADNLEIFLSHLKCAAFELPIGTVKDSVSMTPKSSAVF